MLIHNLAEIIRNNHQGITKWYNNKLKDHRKLFYSSIDIRYSGYKITPIDTNIFPAGFNNLDNDGINLATTYAKQFIKENFFLINKILLLTESHTRNIFYNQNIKNIVKILNLAGYQCETKELNYSDFSEFYINNNNELQLKNGYTPDLIILNNDLIEGKPEILSKISQPVIPSIENGWFNRRKSNHFITYETLLKELETQFSIPLFNLLPYTKKVTSINFRDKHDLIKLGQQIDFFLSDISKLYQTYNIKLKPYAIIKADYGTYGMGVIAVNSGEDIINLNKKNRQKMYTTKGAIEIKDIIIQEGIETIDYYKDFSAEPLIYQINHQTINYFYRFHANKSNISILNSRGMEIAINNNLDQNFYVCYDFVARIASLAACLETKIS